MQTLKRSFGLFAILISQNAYTEDNVTFRPYGFISANVTGASQALDSFGNTNLSSPTGVSPTTTSNSNRARDSFQVAQSRLGTWIDYKNVTGRMEVDFIDFAKASPTTQAVPRLRIANIDYRISEKDTFSFGQDWDVFAVPAKPFTYNIVGLYFRSGNTGFLRQQIKYRRTLDESWTFSTAVGLVSRNSSPSDSEIEMTGLPTVSAAVSKRFSQTFEAGLSGIIGSVRPAAPPVDLQTIYGINSFFSLETESGFKVHEALYFGRNLASSGALSLASATTNGSRHEIGGYITASIPLSTSFSVQAGFGGAQVLEEAGSAIDGISGNTILSNWKVESALTFQPDKKLSFYLQPSFLQTAYLQTSNGQKDIVSALLLQGGALFQF